MAAYPLCYDPWMASQVQLHVAEAISKDAKRGRRVARAYVRENLPEFDAGRLEEILDEHKEK